MQPFYSRATRPRSDLRSSCPQAWWTSASTWGGVDRRRDGEGDRPDDALEPGPASLRIAAGRSRPRAGTALPCSLGCRDSAARRSSSPLAFASKVDIRRHPASLKNASCRPSSARGAAHPVDLRADFESFAIDPGASPRICPCLAYPRGIACPSGDSVCPDPGRPKACFGRL
jgi:hypothetical protein